MTGAKLSEERCGNVFGSTAGGYFKNRTNQTPGCEKLALLDLKVRGHKKTGRIALNELMNITDAIQGIFDYV